MLNSLLKKIDNDTFYLKSLVVHHFLDGSFYIFTSEHEYKCCLNDNYSKNENEDNIRPIHIFYNLYELFKFLGGVHHEQFSNYKK